jgi:hypothetical protein
LFASQPVQKKNFFSSELNLMLLQTTVVWGLRILMTLLSQPCLLHKFRVGSCNGHWLIKSEIVLQNKMVQALGQVSRLAISITSWLVYYRGTSK